MALPAPSHSISTWAVLCRLLSVQLLSALSLWLLRQHLEMKLSTGLWLIIAPWSRTPREMQWWSPVTSHKLTARGTEFLIDSLANWCGQELKHQTWDQGPALPSSTLPPIPLWRRPLTCLCLSFFTWEVVSCVWRVLHWKGATFANHFQSVYCEAGAIAQRYCPEAWEVQEWQQVKAILLLLHISMHTQASHSISIVFLYQWYNMFKENHSKLYFYMTF